MGSEYVPRQRSISAHGRRRTVRQTLATLFVFAALLSWTIVTHTIKSFPRDVGPPRPLQDERLPCRRFAPGADKTLVVLRTGSTELENRLPAHLSTTLRCHANHLIFSDKAQVYAGEEIIDALRDVSKDIRQYNLDFGLYRELSENKLVQQSGEIPTDLKSEDAFGHQDNPGWKLDKWKFLPMVNRTYHERPDMDWYVFIEDDTHLFSSSLYQYLELLDPSDLVYLGQRFRIEPDWFNHGGAGFVMSRATLRLTAEYYKAHVDEIEALTNSHWAGDCVLGRFVQEAGTAVSDVYPHFVKDLPGVLTYGRREWCAPVVTYHHMGQDMIRDMWQFEQQWLQSSVQGTVLRHRDVFRQMLMPRMSDRTGWDNLCDRDEGQVDDAVACRVKCLKHSDCTQWSFSAGACKTAGKPRLGLKAEGVASGWLRDRVEAYTTTMPVCLEQGGWIMPS